MPKHSKISKDHNAWLFKSRNNLGAAKLLAKNGDDFLDQAIYHTQQCAELALKAFLTYHKNPVQKTHDLAALNRQCVETDPLFTSLKESLGILSPYATRFRYPDDYLFPDRNDVLEAIKHAEEILIFVRRRIEYLSHPNSRIF